MLTIVNKVSSLTILNGGLSLAIVNETANFMKRKLHATIYNIISFVEYGISAWGRNKVDHTACTTFFISFIVHERPISCFFSIVQK